MVKKLIWILVIVIVIPMMSVNAYATEPTIPEEYDDLMDGLPEDVQDLLPEGIFSDDSNEIIDGIAQMSGWEYMINIFFDLVGINMRDVVKLLSVICSVLVLSSIINAMKKVIDNQTTSRILELISSAILVATVIELSKEPLERTMLLLDSIKLFVNTLSPLISAMYAMGGNVNAALVSNYGMMVFLTIFENVCIIALETILGVCISLTLASAFIEEGNLAQLSSAIKNGFTFFVGLLMLIFTTVISGQSLLASKADTLTSKTAKMLATQMIPVVGSTVGESLRTAGASIEYLRSNVGVALIIIFVVLILPTLMSIFLHRIVFILSNAIAGLLGCRKEGSVLLELSSIYGYALAILCISAIALLFLMTVFAKSSSPLK